MPAAVHPGPGGGGGGGVPSGQQAFPPLPNQNHHPQQHQQQQQQQFGDMAQAQAQASAQASSASGGNGGAGHPQADSMSVILCTAGYDHTIRFWEAWSGICYRQIALQPQWKQINRLAISPDKNYVAAAGHASVRIWDISSMSNTPVASLEGHTANITALAYSAQGKWIVTGSEDGTVKVWDTRTAQVQRNYQHDAPVNDTVIHPNQGELISCDQAGSVKIWDLGENICTHELVPDEDVAIRSVTIASDGGTLVAGNDMGMCYVWKIHSAQGTEATTLQPVTSFQAHPKYITRCLLSPDTKHLATCSADTTIKVWSTTNFDYALEKTLTGHQRWVWDAAFSADSAYLVTASSDHAARLWDLQSGETVRQYDGHHRAAVCCALNDINLA